MEIARTMIQSYNSLGYHAYNVASHDFPGGLERVRELESIANFPFLSANLLDSATQQPLFKPYIIKKISGKKFGIMPEIRKKSDYIILLAYLERDDEMKLFAQNFDLDFILLSGSFRYSRNLENKNGMLVARCGNIGKYIGIVRFNQQTPDQHLTDISNLMVQISYAEKRMQSFKSAAKDTPLEEFYARDPNILRTIKSLETQIHILKSEIQSAKNPVTYELIALDKSIPDDPEYRSVLKELEQRITRLQSP